MTKAQPYTLQETLAMTWPLVADANALAIWRDRQARIKATAAALEEARAQAQRLEALVHHLRMCRECAEACRECGEAMKVVLAQHFIDKNGHLKSCGGACDPDCEETRAALQRWREVSK